MARIPLGRGAYNRTFGREAEIVLLNRFFETNPANQTDGVALLSRPGSTREEDFGDGPITGTFTLPSLFEGDLFLSSGTEMFRYDVDGNTTPIVGAVATDRTLSFAGVKGAGPYERVFIADGTSLQYYGGQQYAATLTYVAGAISDDIVVVDGVYYAFAAASLDTGSPAGTVTNPWKVLSSGTAAQSLANLRKAINASGIPGTDYSTALTTENARVEANSNTSTTVGVRARVGGPPATSIPVSVTVTGGDDGLSWNAATLQPTTHVLYGVPTPDDVGIVSVAELGSFILCVAANSQRVYFIRPGETTIDPLDFFEAESDTDDLIEVVKVGDQVWLIGLKSIEPWYLNGSTDPVDNPFSRVQGRPISVGAKEGTVVVLNNGVCFIGHDMVVYRVEGGQEPISNPGIAERVRKAYKYEKDNP